MDLSRLGPILRTRWGAATDTGPVRPQNEDCWLAEPPLHAVADGMGGHTDGALASSTALRTLAAGLRPDVLPGRRPDLVDLDRAIAAAAVAVAALATPAAPWTAPGTTLTGALPLEGADNPHWIVFNIGDSRTYLVAGGQVRQLTRDHSARQEIRDHGVLASPLPPTNVVTRALGAGMRGLPEADYGRVPLCEQDQIVLCSDGVHAVLTPRQLGQAVMKAPDPQTAANTLVDLAITHGTRDNATAVVIQVTAASGDEDVPRAAHARRLLSIRPAPMKTARRPQEERGH